MRYEIGKSFVCESIEQSKPLPDIDYPIPTESENQKYLNLMGRQVLTQFEKEVVARREQRQQYERDKADHNW